MITIGIFGSRGKSAVSEIITDELKRQGKTVYVIETNKDSSTEIVKNAMGSVDYVIIELSREEILDRRIEAIKFNVLIQTALEEERNELIDEIQRKINYIKEEGYIIFNSDSIQKINFQCESVYPVTYGLNGKTTVTASSIDDLEGTYFSYCLQRNIFSTQGTVIQPFEKPVRVKGKYDDIYYYLAAYTCLLVLGYSFY